MTFRIELVYIDGAITCTYKIGEEKYLAAIYCGAVPFTVEFLQFNCRVSNASINRV